LHSHTQTKASYQEVAGEQSFQFARKINSGGKLLENRFWGKTMSVNNKVSNMGFLVKREILSLAICYNSLQF